MDAPSARQGVNGGCFLSAQRLMIEVDWSAEAVLSG
jgi:hypothetical protein